MSQAQQRWPPRSDPGPGGEVGAKCAASTRLSGSDAESDGLSLLNQLGGEGARTARPQTARREHNVRSATQLSDSEGGRNTNPRQPDTPGTDHHSPEAPTTIHRTTHSHLWKTSQDRYTPDSPRAKKNFSQTYGNVNAKPPTGDPHPGPGGRRAGMGMGTACACGGSVRCRRVRVRIRAGGGRGLRSGRSGGRRPGCIRAPGAVCCPAWSPGAMSRGAEAGRGGGRWSPPGATATL